MSPEILPLFPLQTVLFPGATLKLRLFEQRYLDMVRDCARENSGFGVICAWPAEADGKARHARVGTEAMMVDFDRLEDGLLGLSCRGQRRFRIGRTRARDNGLLVAEIKWFPPEPAVPVPARFGALQTLVQELLRQPDLADVLDVEIEDASSLGRTLSSILSLSLEHAQALLEMNDPIARLEGLISLMGAESAED